MCIVCVLCFAEREGLQIGGLGNLEWATRDGPNNGPKSQQGPFGLLVLASKDIQEYTAVYLRVFRAKSRYIVLMCSDQSRSSLHLDYDKTTYGAFIDLDPAKERLSLRTLIDHSIVESFGGEGKACITARVYPSLAIDGEAHLYAFNNGTDNIKISKLAAWSLKAAQIS